MTHLLHPCIVATRQDQLRCAAGLPLEVLVQRLQGELQALLPLKPAQQAQSR
jgi:hypothetical protein